MHHASLVFRRLQLLNSLTSAAYGTPVHRPDEALHAAAATTLCSAAARPCCGWDPEPRNAETCTAMCLQQAVWTLNRPRFRRSVAYGCNSQRPTRLCLTTSTAARRRAAFARRPGNRRMDDHHGGSSPDAAQRHWAVLRHRSVCVLVRRLVAFRSPQPSAAQDSLPTAHGIAAARGPSVPLLAAVCNSRPLIWCAAVQCVRCSRRQRRSRHRVEDSKFVRPVTAASAVPSRLDDPRRFWRERCAQRVTLLPPRRCGRDIVAEDDGRAHMRNEVQGEEATRRTTAARLVTGIYCLRPCDGTAAFYAMGAGGGAEKRVEEGKRAARRFEQRGRGWKRTGTD
jgi:hypothetical protein